MRNRFSIFDRFSYLPALCAVGCANLAFCIQPHEPAVLEPGKTISGELGGREPAEFQFVLQKGQYAQVVVEQRSINVAIACFGPDGKERMAADTYWIGEPETAEIIGDLSGTYRFRLTPNDPKDPAGEYTITLRSVERATGKHRYRVAAAAAYARACKQVAITPEQQADMIANMKEALKNWHAAGDLFEEARSMYSLGNIYVGRGDVKTAEDYYARSLPVARASGIVRSEAWALHYTGEYQNLFGNKRKAVEYQEQALPLMRKAHDRVGEGIVLNALATASSRSGEKQKALEYFEQSLAIMVEVRDRRRQASLSGNMGVTYSDLGEYTRSLECYERSLALHRATGNRSGEAIALNNVGTAYSNLGQYQKALDAHTAGLEINRSLNNRWAMAVDLNNIAFVYNNLGDRRRALNYYQEALDILRSMKDQWSLAHTLNNVGEIHADLGDYQKALALHNEALACRRAVKDPDGEANSLTNIGRIHAKLGDREAARRDFERALEIARAGGDPRQVASTLRNIGATSREDGQYERARTALTEGLEISRRITDRKGEVNTVLELARLERDGGNLAEARRRADEALAGFESLRLTVASPALRASLFASARDVQELEIEVLMRMHHERPDGGLAAQALSVVERGRARSLLEQLGESSTEIRRGADPQLLDREQQLVRLIGAKAERQTRMLSGKHTDADAAAARKELDALTADLEQVQSRIREGSPQYAALTQPTPLNLREIQNLVLDDDTVLLEYSLGAARSFVWAVTKECAEVFELPAKARIESAAKRLYDLVNKRAARPELGAAAQETSRMLLGPVAARLPGKRLLIVGDGVLQYLPFAALPDPAAADSPLIVNHEIATAPSASVIAILRREMEGRRPAEKQLAVVADPVFSVDDARIEQATRAVSPGTTDFVRLRFSRREADQISAFLPAGATFKALDFNASRETVLNPDFGRHRILHFATHSVLNNERPELSGVVLSLVDRSGHRRDGFLRLYEIYNLRLTSDLVVLSACQTALGGEIHGEGLIGLTRGFLYAGAPRVVASLWEVDDRTSAELMKRFYEGMLVRGERPAAALRAAQVSMWKRKGWEAPYYWAAYTLHGEWR